MSTATQHSAFDRSGSKSSFASSSDVNSYHSSRSLSNFSNSPLTEQAANSGHNFATGKILLPYFDIPCSIAAGDQPPPFTSMRDRQHILSITSHDSRSSAPRRLR